MKPNLDKITEDVLLILYHRNIQYNRGPWEFWSAFKLLSYPISDEMKQVVRREFIRRGWGDFTPLPSEDGDRISFSLSPRGEAAAIETLEMRGARGFLAKLHRLNWATWGGIASMIAAFAALISAFPIVLDLMR